MGFKTAPTGDRDCSSEKDGSKCAASGKKAYRWKAKLLRVQSDNGKAQHFIKGYRRLHLPQVFGIGDNGTWRWRFLPLQVDTGAIVELGIQGKNGAACVELEPLVRLRPAQWRNSHGLDAELTVFPRTGLHLRKIFSVPCGKAVVTTSMQGLHFPNCLSLHCEWRMGSTSSWAGPEARLSIAGAPIPQLRQVEVKRTESLGAGIKRRFTPRPGCWIGASLTASASKGLGASEAGSGLSHPQPWWRRVVRLPAHEASLSASFLGDAFGRDVQSLDIIDSETQKWQLRGGTQSKRNPSVTRQIGVVAGHWIDPGDETGAPGELEFNMEVADCLERKLTGNGWTVFRPDRHATGLDWDHYLRWVARQSRRGTPVIEIHGQGQDAAIEGISTGVVGCRDAPLNQSLAASFGFFPMDWTRMAIPRQGGVIVESFVTDQVNRMDADGRAREAVRISNRIAESVRQADAKVRSNLLTVESGCSTTGCPIGKYGHALEAEATESKLLDPTHPLGGSPMLQDSLPMPPGAFKTQYGR